MIEELEDLWYCPLEAPPDSARVFQAMHGLRHRVWLDSASNPHSLGRYSYLAADPWKVLKGRDGQFDLDDAPLPEDRPWSAFQAHVSRDPARVAQAKTDLPPFRGGVFFFLGYELGRTLETLPAAGPAEFLTPDIWVGWFDTVVCFDHERNRAWIVSNGRPEVEHSRRRARAHQRLRSFEALIRDGIEPSPQDPFPNQPIRPLVESLLSVPLSRFPTLNVQSHFQRASYEKVVERAVDYIHAGDCFQVNIAQRLLTVQDRPPESLYLDLRRKNPAPFAGYFDLGDTQILSASPERFLRVAAGGAVETRPIKGTRPRGQTPQEDRALAWELTQSAKDRAENVMIVDLMRNDLGRVCRPGTIEVAEVCRLESYQTVHHLVSVVKGTLAEGKTAIDLLMATFPGGSVTGAPKIRSMEIIAELERVPRGPYCGCIGWLGDDGQMDTNILIRTFTAKDGWLQFPVGGGIVADSVSAREYEETLHKAEGLLKALDKK